MAIKLRPESRQQLVASIKRYVAAQTYFQERSLDLEGVCSEKEFTYWPEVDADRVKRKARPH